VGAHRHPCAQRAISAASGHSNANEQSCTACVCQHLASHLRLSPPPAERESALPCSALLCPALPVLLDCSSLQLSPSITTAGPSGLVVDTQTQQPFRLSSLHRTALHCTALHRTVRLRHCLALLRWIAPAARQNPLPPPHSDRHSRTYSHSQDCCVSRPGSDKHHAAPITALRARINSSPTCRLLAPLDIAAPPPVTLLDLAASATVSAQPPWHAANDNTSTASNPSPVDDLFT
jgi:hypothetical protein